MKPISNREDTIMTDTTVDHGQANAAAWYETIKELVGRLNEAAGDDQAEQDREATFTEIQEGPLSVMVRDGWRQPGGASEGAEEFEILLSTGGPALRIWGWLDGSNQPKECELQHQDWGTPWTKWVPAPYDNTFHDTLLIYASQFYFGD